MCSRLAAPKGLKTGHGHRSSPVDAHTSERRARRPACGVPPLSPSMHMLTHSLAHSALLAGRVQAIHTHARTAAGCQTHQTVTGLKVQSSPKSNSVQTRGRGKTGRGGAPRGARNSFSQCHIVASLLVCLPLTGAACYFKPFRPDATFHAGLVYL